MSTIAPRDIECDGCGQPAGERCLTGSPSMPKWNRSRTRTHLARRADAYMETLLAEARDAPAGTPLADAYAAARENEYLARGAIAPFIAGFLYAQAQNNQETA